MLELVSKEQTRTFSRQDEKLRAIKDLKMPMARFMNGILIGQAKQFIPTAPKRKMSLTARGKKKLLYKPLQCSRWSNAKEISSTVNKGSKGKIIT